MRYLEALSSDDQRTILDLERRVIDAKEDLIDVEDPDEKESIKQRIEDIKQDIDSIEQSAQESIKEDFFDAEKINTVSGKSYVEIYKNPSRKEIWDSFQKDVSANEYGDLRGFLLENGDLYIAVCEEDEVIHDDILKILDKKGIAERVTGWETLNPEEYLAVFIDKNFGIVPSFNFYSEEDLEYLLEFYKESVENNFHLSHMNFVYEV